MFGLQINPGKEFFGPNSMVLEEGLCDSSRWLSLLNMYRYFSFETRVVRKLLNALDLPIILWNYVKFVWLYEHFECVSISILLKCISYGTTQYEVENDICDVLTTCFLLTEVMTGARLGRSIVLQSVLERKEARSTPDINQMPISIDSLWDLVNIPARRTINWRRETKEFWPLFSCIGGIVALSRKNNCFSDRLTPIYCSTHLLIFEGMKYSQ